MKNISKEISQVHKKFWGEVRNHLRIYQAIDDMIISIKNGGKIISCGNGGSMCDAMHFAEELTGKFKNPRKALSAIAISDPSHISCVANDFGYDQIFSRYVEANASSWDTLLVISTSGNSANVINAVQIAKQKEMRVIGLLGKDGGQLKDMVNIPIIVPSDKSERIQEIHIQLIHTFIDGIEKGLHL